jgi:hypothetical protein
LTAEEIEDVGTKNPQNAANARAGAAKQPKSNAPAPNQPSVKPCCKHWIAVRVEFEDTKKLVETGMRMKLKLNNGETHHVPLGKSMQPGGKYDTNKILSLNTDCEVSFPDTYDAELKPSK